VEDEVFADPHEFLFAQQNGEQSTRPRRFHAGLHQHFGERGGGQPGLLEGALDGGARLLLVVFEGDLVTW